MSKHNILLVTYALHPGGMEQSLSRLVKYLKEEEYEVSIVLTEEKGDWFDLFNEQFCKTNLIPISKAGVAVHLWNLRKFILKSNCDILYLVCDKFAQSILPFLPKHIKVISAIRLDDPYFYYLSATNRDCISAYAVNSLKLHDTLEPLVNNIPIEIIQNGFEVPQKEKIDNRLKFEIPLKLLFVGRLTDQKQVLILPDIIKKCKDLNLNVILNIVGDGELMPDLISKIKLYGLEHNIKIIGTVSKNEAENWYLKSHVVLFPSIGEGLPNVLIETQGCGCVPISNLLPKITNTVIKNNVTGIIVENNNIDEYVNAIALLYNNDNVWKSFSENGMQWIKENFSIDQEKKKYISLFENTLNTKVIKQNTYNILHIFRLIHIRDWTPIGIKTLKNKIENILMFKNK